MASKAYYDTYRDQLASLYHGHALWVPDSAGLYDHVRVGDVGFVKQGHFLRMFNALFPADHNTQAFGVPEGFVPLDMGAFNNIRTVTLHHGDYLSTTVTVEHGDGHQTAGPEETASSFFKCRKIKDKGAFLSLPFDGERVDAIRTKAFETYIRKHCDSWLDFSIANELDVRLEDIILVTGCDLTSSWAMAAFINSQDTDIKLSVHVSEGVSAKFQWSFTRQPHNNEPNQNTLRTHCVFIRGFRAKRIFPFIRTMKAAAGPRPDNPDNEPESSIELLREPVIPDYRDPLIGILDYIAEQHPDQELALAHEDDLKMIEGVDVLTADAAESFLRRNKCPVRTEHGAARLAGKDEVVPEVQRVTFFAQANADVRGESIPLSVHPVLMEYLLKLDITSQAPDYDFGLPSEDHLSPAVHPPVLTLILEHKQGCSQKIEVQASDKGVGVIVRDVLKTVGANLRLSSSHREWSGLDDDKRREVEAAFEDRARTEDKRSRGLRRVDYLSGRNRLQKFSKHPLLEDHGVTQPFPSQRAPTPLSASERAEEGLFDYS